MPRPGRSSRMWARIGLPATCNSTLGRVWVCGLSRVPTPATGMIAIGLPATREPHVLELLRSAGPSPRSASGPRGIREPALELVDARDRRGIHAVHERQVETQVVAELDQ